MVRPRRRGAGASSSLFLRSLCDLLVAAQSAAPRARDSLQIAPPAAPAPRRRSRVPGEPIALQTDPPLPAMPTGSGAARWTSAGPGSVAPWRGCLPLSPPGSPGRFNLHHEGVAFVKVTVDRWWQWRLVETGVELPGLPPTMTIGRRRGIAVLGGDRRQARRLGGDLPGSVSDTATVLVLLRSGRRHPLFLRLGPGRHVEDAVAPQRTAADAGSQPCTQRSSQGRRHDGDHTTHQPLGARVRPAGHLETTEPTLTDAARAAAEGSIGHRVLRDRDPWDLVPRLEPNARCHETSRRLGEFVLTSPPTESRCAGTEPNHARPPMSEEVRARCRKRPHVTTAHDLLLRGKYLPDRADRSPCSRPVGLACWVARYAANDVTHHTHFQCVTPSRMLASVSQRRCRFRTPRTLSPSPTSWPATGRPFLLTAANHLSHCLTSPIVDTQGCPHLEAHVRHAAEDEGGDTRWSALVALRRRM